MKNTTLAEAEAAIRKTLPGDTTIGPVTIDNNGGSCAFVTASGPTLAKELGNPKVGDPQGIVGIELSTTTDSLNIEYDPNNIQDAALQPLGFDPTSSC